MPVKNTFSSLEHSLVERHGFKQTFADPFISKYEKSGKVAYIYYLGLGNGYRIRCYNIESTLEFLQTEAAKTVAKKDERITALLEKIQENTIEAWEDDLEGTKTVVILEDFDKNADNELKGSKVTAYNGWMEDLEAILNEQKVSNTAEAKEILHDAGYITGSLWHTVDIAERYKEMNEDKPELTADQLLEVRDSIENGHDANIGINWEVIDIHTNLIID